MPKHLFQANPLGRSSDDGAATGSSVQCLPCHDSQWMSSYSTVDKAALMQTQPPFRELALFVRDL